MAAELSYWTNVADVGIEILASYSSGSANCTGVDFGVAWLPTNAAGSVSYSYPGGASEAANHFIAALTTGSFQYGAIPQSQTAAGDVWSSQYGTFAVVTPLPALFTTCFSNCVQGSTPPPSPPSPPAPPMPPLPRMPPSPPPRSPSSTVAINESCVYTTSACSGVPPGSLNYCDSSALGTTVRAVYDDIPWTLKVRIFWR